MSIRSTFSSRGLIRRPSGGGPTSTGALCDVRHTSLCSRALAGIPEERRLLPVTMPLPIMTSNRSLAARLFAGAGLLLLLVGVVFVPLCSALSLCVMPCCHPASPAPSSAGAPQDPCCTISRGDTANDAVRISPAVPQESTLDAAASAAVVLFTPAPNPPVGTEFATQVFRPLERPLHVLNCVFLI